MSYNIVYLGISSKKDAAGHCTILLFIHAGLVTDTLLLIVGILPRRVSLVVW